MVRVSHCARGWVVCNVPGVEYGVTVAEHELIRIYALGSKTWLLLYTHTHRAVTTMNSYEQPHEGEGYCSNRLGDGSRIQDVYYQLHRPRAPSLPVSGGHWRAHRLPQEIVADSLNIISLYPDIYGLFLAYDTKISVPYMNAQKCYSRRRYGFGYARSAFRDIARMLTGAQQRCPQKRIHIHWPTLSSWWHCSAPS